MPMYMVGANALSDFWRIHPESEGELRALHALLAAAGPEQVSDRLGAAAEFEGRTAEVRLATAIVTIELSAAAGVARYAAVRPAGEEEE